MRINIDIDTRLLEEAMLAMGLTTKKATVEEALRRLVVDHRRRDAIASLAGIGWDGELANLRQDRVAR